MLIHQVGLQSIGRVHFQGVTVQGIRMRSGKCAFKGMKEGDKSVYNVHRTLHILPFSYEIIGTGENEKKKMLPPLFAHLSHSYLHPSCHSIQPAHQEPSCHH